jgi:hypothetical protein
VNASREKSWIVRNNREVMVATKTSQQVNNVQQGLAGWQRRENVQPVRVRPSGAACQRQSGCCASRGHC